jgi:thiamine-monophosphate kinase
MAARPLGILVSLALPGNEVETAARELSRGAGEAAAGQGVPILGGDISSSPGPLVLDVVALGQTPRPILRSGCRPGDHLWVTGWLGGSAAAADLWYQGREPPDELREAFARPRPRIQEALWLAEHGEVHALIDLSDGLAGDAGHLSAASGVRVVVEEASLPLHPAMDQAVDDQRRCRDLALTGGEDYEVCLAAPPGAVEGLVADFQNAFGIPLTCVGRVEGGSGADLEGPSGAIRPLAEGGFNHFGRKGQR